MVVVWRAVQVPVASSLFGLFVLARSVLCAVTSDASRGLPCPVRDRDRGLPDAEAAWRQRPTTQADGLGYGTDGSGSDRSPRSQRSIDDELTGSRAGDTIRTIDRPFAWKV